MDGAIAVRAHMHRRHHFRCPGTIRTRSILLQGTQTQSDTHQALLLQLNLARLPFAHTPHPAPAP
jgi:hypothetical protein